VRISHVYLQCQRSYFLAFLDFRNLDDPNDKSFEPHATDYPVVEIEYPNYGASERFILLFPIDKDDYQPIKELMYTLYTTVECK
jgi:H3 lysine-79-specific histone-lysine N-methyltransferase